jgi:hypothetical protein
LWFLKCSLTVAGMCSCRLFSAGMVFCQIQVKGSGKKPWKHARRPAGLSMLSWRQEFVPVDKLAK